MIHYSLICEKKHDFDIWFKNSADYDKQVKGGLREELANYWLIFVGA